MVEGITAAGIDHVRLSYHYLDLGDTDGYASLLDAAAVLYEPGHARVSGRVAVAESRRLRWCGAHQLHAVFAGEGRVAAVGRFNRGDGVEGGGVEVDFADIITLSEHGLLVTQRCYYFVRPNGKTIE